MEPKSPGLSNPEHSYIYEDLIEDFDPSLTDIGSLNAVHDRHQFESKFHYELTVDSQGTSREYEIDMYFFIPKNLGINSSTYTLEDFYGDITNYIRVASSEVSRDHLDTARGFLPSLDKYFAVHLTTRKRQQLASLVAQEIRLFGCSFNSKLKNLHYGLFQVLSKKSSEFLSDPNRRKVLKNLLEHIEILLNSYRKFYVDKVRKELLLIDEEVKRALFLVDEYNSYRLESVLTSIYRLLQPYAENFAELIFTIEQILRGEVEYRSRVGLINIEKKGGDAVKEYYHYRLGLLKKYVSSVLFLEVKNLKNDKKYRNIIAAIGAALAACWAALANVQHWQAVQNNGGDLNFRLLTIIAIGVVAYVFKDRIKEWTKNYFNDQLKHRLPDFERVLYYTQYDPTGEKKRYYLGKSTEFMRYLSKEVVSSDVLYLREIGHETELEPERHDVVIHYAKKLKIASRESLRKLEKVESIKDVVRFDFSKFLAKLDDPHKSLNYFDREHGVMHIKAPKVYHINVVFRYAICERNSHSRMQKRNIELERIRIILNKQGILRIEKVIPRGEMKYQETMNEC